MTLDPSPGMRLAGASIVKNECDIIEVFVRHNLRFLDRLFIVDNMSTDSTPEILARMKQEGLPIELLASDRTDHPQSAVLTELLPGICAGGFDYVFPLDGDEFLVAQDRGQLIEALRAIPPDRCGTLRWKHYVLRPEDNVEERNVLRRMTHRVACRGDPPWFAKVVIPGALVRERRVRLGPGSHVCVIDDRPCEQQHLVANVDLAHFPARSEAQFLSKVIIGEFSLRSRARRLEGEGRHWYDLYEQFRRTLSVDRQTLHDAPIAFGAGTPLPAEIVCDPVTPVPDLRYAGLTDVDWFKRVFEYADAHFRKLATTKYSQGNVSIGWTAFGVLAYLESDTVIGRSIRMYGEWASREIEFLKQFVRAGECILDIGANIGTHSVPLAMAVGLSGLVIAFEPQRVPFQLLCANAALNNRTNIKALNLAVGAAPSWVRVPVITDGNVGALGLERCEHGEPVQVVTLDSMSLPQVHLIKIDVEGMEGKVLDGARATISRYRPLLFLENNKPENSAALIARIIEWGYECWWHLEPYYNLMNFYGNPNDIFSTAGRPEINLFCAPKERRMTVPGLTKVTSPEDDWRPALATRVFHDA